MLEQNQTCGADVKFRKLFKRISSENKICNADPEVICNDIEQLPVVP